jgi:hypothetical protein
MGGHRRNAIGGPKWHQRREADQHRDQERESERGQDHRLVHQVDLDDPPLQMPHRTPVQAFAGLRVPGGGD